MKSVLRQKAKTIRKSLDIKAISDDFVKKIRQFELYKSANHVMLYYPTSSEFNLLDLLKDDKTFYFPRVDSNKLLVCPFFNGCGLEKSNLGIYEPCSKPVSAKILDLIIVPALMVDKKGYRLGYGGGFYDRFLAQNLLTETLTVIPNELFVDALPIEDCDVAIKNIIVY